MWGLAPLVLSAGLIVIAPVPDLLVTRDGRDIGIANQADRLLVLRQSEGGYAQQNLLELAGTDQAPLELAEWSRSQCSKEFCRFSLDGLKRNWEVLVARNRDQVAERALAAACARVDIVIAARYLPRSCRPRWLKADRGFLAREGGLAIHLDESRVDTVAADQGEHGWWRGRD